MNNLRYHGDMKRLNLKTIIWKEGEHYVAQCLNVDVSSFGSTQKEAMENIKEALELYFENKPVSAVPEVESPTLVNTSLELV